MGKVGASNSPLPLKDEFTKIPISGWAVVRGRGVPERMITLGGPTESQM